MCIRSQDSELLSEYVCVTSVWSGVLVALTSLQGRWADVNRQERLTHERFFISLLQQWKTWEDPLCCFTGCLSLISPLCFVLHSSIWFPVFLFSVPHESCSFVFSLCSFSSSWISVSVPHFLFISPFLLSPLPPFLSSLHPFPSLGTVQLSAAFSIVPWPSPDESKVIGVVNLFTQRQFTAH